VSAPDGSVKAEGDFNADADRDWLAVFHCGGELPSLDGFDGFFVETHADGPQNPQVVGTAVGANDNVEYDASLVFGFAGLLGVFGIRFEQRARSGHSSADVIDAASDATAPSRTDTGTIAGTHATP
jgi:hypothetical protein